MKHPLYRTYYYLPLVVVLGFLNPSTFLNHSSPLITEIFPKELDIFVKYQYSLPRYVEANYSPLGRSPAVDALLGDPFYLPTYAQLVSTELNQLSHSNSLYQMSSKSFMAGGMPISSELRFHLKKRPKCVPDSFYQVFDKEMAEKIYTLWLAFIQVYQESEAILAVLSPEDKKWLKENYEAFFFGSQDQEEYDFFTTDSAMPFRFFELASRINIARLTDCARKLALIVDEVYQHRFELASLSLDQDFTWEEQGVKLFISSKSHSIYNKNADFFLNLGGDNTYYTSAGGTEGTRPAALHISLEGNNFYVGERFAQGSGFLGVGVLANFAGNNTYHAKSYSQGAGFFGTGLLVDLGGNNHYEIDFFGQSCALFGGSLLWNKGGSSQYLAHQGLAQAASSTLGIAFLVDNGGNNHYSAGIPNKAGTRYCGIGQGGSIGVRYSPWDGHPSLYGGLSFLNSSAGNNTYKTSWFGQGSAYFLGVGILVDEGDNGNFSAEVDSQGQGLHLAAGLVLRKGNNSHFDGGWGSLGTGGDRSCGMVISTGGYSSYKGTVQAIGTARKPKALGIFINLQGHNNYSFQTESNGNIQKPQSPIEWPSALFISLGGANKYSENVDDMQRGSNRSWGIPDHSLGIDKPIDLTVDDLTDQLFSQFPLSPRVGFPFDPINGWHSNTAYLPLNMAANQTELRQQIQQILKADYDQRRYLYECIDLFRFSHSNEPIDLSDLLANPAMAPEDQFNYAALWALYSYSNTQLEQVIKTLSRESIPSNQSKNNGVYLDKVIEALKHESIVSDYAREMAIKLIGTLAKDRAAPILAQIMKNDPSEENQATAAFYLAQIQTPDALSLLQPGLTSPSEIVRYSAAYGLRDTRLPQALNLITPLFTDPSFYVRRAAAMTAISLHDKKGIPVLLDTLKFQTLDTTENYGDNIYSELSKYVGINLGVNREAWLTWWKEVHQTFEFPSSPLTY